MLLGEYGRIGPARTPEAKPATGPYPFDAWLTLPPGSSELNRIESREAATKLLFVELLIPSATPIDTTAVKARLTSLGYRLKPVQTQGPAVQGTDFELVKDGAIIEAGALIVMETTSTHQKLWVTFTTIN